MNELLNRINMQDMETIQLAQMVSISKGNAKMGNIPSVSLPAVTTCPHGVPCAKACYAVANSAQYANVRRAYERNLAILTTNPEAYWLAVHLAASMCRFFRYHVSGDIPNKAYLERMIQTARDLPNTVFLCFTKRYQMVNAWIDENGNLPENLKMLFSAWGPNYIVPNPHNLPMCEVIFRSLNNWDDSWFDCPGNCELCATLGQGCWNLKHGETVGIMQHGKGYHRETHAEWEARAAKKSNGREG